MSSLLPMAPVDRRCRAWSLDNSIRRRWAPAGREIDLLGLEPSQTVADVGTGVGYFLEGVLRRLGPHGLVYAVDPDAQNLEQARRRVAGDPRAKLMVGTATDLRDIPDRAVDRALLSLVLCCMVDKVGAMEEAWRVLKPGGRLYVSYPRWSRPGGRRRRSLRVTPEIWGNLLAAHPWVILPVRRSWAFQRHLLAKPG